MEVSTAITLLTITVIILSAVIVALLAILIVLLVKIVKLVNSIHHLTDNAAKASDWLSPGKVFVEGAKFIKELRR